MSAFSDRLGAPSSRTHPAHNLGHDGILQVGQWHSDVRVVLLGQEEVPQSEGTRLGLERLDDLRVRLPPRGGVVGHLSVEDGLGGDAILL